MSTGDFPEVLSQEILAGANLSREIGRRAEGRNWKAHGTGRSRPEHQEKVPWDARISIVRVRPLWCVCQCANSTCHIVDNGCLSVLWHDTRVHSETVSHDMVYVTSMVCRETSDNKLSKPMHVSQRCLRLIACRKTSLGARRLKNRKHKMWRLAVVALCTSTRARRPTADFVIRVEAQRLRARNSDPWKHDFHIGKFASQDSDIRLHSCCGSFAKICGDCHFSL